MKTIFGIDSGAYRSGKIQEITWDSKRVINAHMLLVGKSGTGKTYTLTKVIEQLKQQSNGKMRIRIIDVHGDIDIPGNSSVKFSESSVCGFNPLSINQDPDFGGVRKRIKSFMSALNKTSIIKQEDIVFCKSDGRYTTFYLKNKEELVASKNLGTFESILDGSTFFRIHHSYIVNIEYVVSIIKKTCYYCEMINNINLPVAKRRQESLNKFLKTVLLFNNIYYTTFIVYYFIQSNNCILS